jgi:small subunit ribosomal protein S18
MAKPVRTKNKDNARRAKKKVSLLNTERVEYVDWKDVNLLRRFMSDRAKIRARRVTGNSTQQQAEIARAIKNAREMALLPYASRVTQTRGAKRDGERGGRRERDRDLPAPETEPIGRDGDADQELGVEEPGVEEPGVVEPGVEEPGVEEHQGDELVEQVAGAEEAGS